MPTPSPLPRLSILPHLPMKKVLLIILLLIALLIVSIVFLQRPATEAETIKVKSTTEGITLKAKDS